VAEPARAFNGVPLPNGSPYHAVPIASTIEELKQIHEFVEELRFVSQLSGPLQYVAGAFFSDTRGRVPFAVTIHRRSARNQPNRGVLTIGIPVNRPILTRSSVRTITHASRSPRYTGKLPTGSRMP